MLSVTPFTDDSLRRIESKQLKIWPQPSDGSEFIPLFPGLAVVGVSYREFHEFSKNVPSHKTAENKSSRGELSYPRSHSSQPQGTNSSKLHESDTALWLSNGETHVPNTNGIKLYFGGSCLTWCPKCSERKAQEYIVEIGCTAELGQSAVSSTSMTNGGSVAISYNWVRCDHKDPFHLNRYSNMRFAFDCWGGVILPGETHRLPCLYKANEPGYFSEDWRLVTRPELEGGARIVLRLWGITRKQDVSRRDRDNIEEKIKHLITRALAEHRVAKIIDYLPLKEIPLKDTRFPLVHLGPDLFVLKNPLFQYHSAHVYRLRKMLEMFETQLLSYTKNISCSEASLQSATTDRQSEVSETDMAASIIDEAHHSPTKTPSTKAIARLSSTSLRSSSDQRGIGRGLATFMETDEQVVEEEHTVQESECSLYVESSDEFSPHKLTGTFSENTSYLKKVLKRKTDMDRLLTTLDLTTKASSNRPTLLPRKRAESVTANQVVDSFINIVDPDFYVDTLRKKILEMPRLEIQEAASEVLNDELTTLSFRVQEPIDNWKLTMGYTYLARAMDSFSDFAASLKTSCCRGQYEEEVAKRRALDAAAMLEIGESHTSVYEAEEPQKPRQESVAAAEDITANNADEVNDRSSKTMSISETQPPGQHTKFSTELSGGNVGRTTNNFLDLCSKLNPRQVFTPTRFQDHYYSRLHTRMYQLLSDFVETMDKVWASKKVLKMDQELGFTKIRDIHPGANFSDYMDAPLAPSWIKLVQTLDALAASNRKRTQVTSTL